MNGYESERERESLREFEFVQRKSKVIFLKPFAVSHQFSIIKVDRLCLLSLKPLHLCIYLLLVK